MVDAEKDLLWELKSLRFFKRRISSEDLLELESHVADDILPCLLLGAMLILSQNNEYLINPIGLLRALLTATIMQLLCDREKGLNVSLSGRIKSF